MRIPVDVSHYHFVVTKEPGEVSNHPQIFATLTAPSFGVVHRSVSSGRKSKRCHRGPQSYCPYGVNMKENDEIAGSPLCSKCYDYRGAVIWNAVLTKAWQRSTIHLRCELAKLMDLSKAEDIFVGQSWLCSTDTYRTSKLRTDHDEARVLALECFMEEREPGRNEVMTRSDSKNVHLKLAEASLTRKVKSCQGE